MTKKKVIVLASGGLDSTLVMLKLLEQDYYVVPMFSNYHQYSYWGEATSVRSIVEWIQSATGANTTMGALGDLASQQPPATYKTLKLSGLLEDVVEVEINTGNVNAACPGRILSFTGAACIWAFTNGWEEGSIAIGIHSGDKDQDSCRVGYEGALDETVKSLTQDCMNIITPLMGMSREQMAMELGKSEVPFDLMYNCYWYPPCGWQSINMHYHCPGCRRKEEAMRIVGKVPNDRGPNVPIMDISVTRRDWKKWL